MPEVLVAGIMAPVLLLMVKAGDAENIPPVNAPGPESVTWPGTVSFAQNGEL